MAPTSYQKTLFGLSCPRFTEDVDEQYSEGCCPAIFGNCFFCWPTPGSSVPHQTGRNRSNACLPRQNVKWWRLSTAQKAYSISPVPSGRFVPKCAEHALQTSDVSWWDTFVIHENYPAVASPFFCPDLQQWRNGPAIISNSRQHLRSSLL